MDGQAGFRRAPGVPAPGVRVIKPEISEIMRRLLRLVVTDGTGKNAAAPGYLVGGKTGTSDKYHRKALLTTFVIVVLGRLEPVKNVAGLLDAMAGTDAALSLRAVLLGTGALESQLRERAAALGLSDRVRFLGFRDDVAACLFASDVFAMPSLTEGLPLSLLEGMAAGLPIVLTRTGGTRELVEEGVNGLTFDWADVDGLVTHLRLLATNRALVRQMGAASRARAMQFSWDTIAESFFDMFAATISCRQNTSVSNPATS